MTFDHKWPAKRSKNLESMLKRMVKDEAYLFEMASYFLSTFSDIPWKLGDENMALVMCWIAANLDNRGRLSKKSKSKKRHKIG